LTQLHVVAPVAFELVAVELADRRRERAEPRLRARWKLDLAQLLEHNLPGEVVVDAVLERQLDDREPVDGPRAPGDDVGYAVTNPLDRDRDLLLHLLGGKPRQRRDHNDLRIGDVGVGFDLELPESPDPETDERDAQRDGDESLPQR